MRLASNISTCPEPPSILKPSQCHSLYHACAMCQKKYFLHPLFVSACKSHGRGPPVMLWRTYPLSLCWLRKGRLCPLAVSFASQSGTAMGTRMAPSYANSFTRKFEREFLQTQTALPLVWWRFTDALSAIWTHGEQQLQMFLWELNHHHTSINFTANWSTEEVCFWTHEST